jgi:hypothetical protein
LCHDTSEPEAAADTQQHVVDRLADPETRCIVPIVIFEAFTVQPAELAIANVQSLGLARLPLLQL